MASEIAENDKKIQDYDKSIFKKIYFCFFIGAILLLVGWYFKNEAVIICTIALISFLIPIALAFSYGYNLATIDNGVVRKCITISLTVVYIILLSIFVANNPSILCQNCTLAANSSPSASSPPSVSAVYGASALDANSIDNNNSPSQTPQSESQTQEIPSDAIKNIYQNFLYIYTIIIGFYFGSRTAESYWNTNLSKEILKDASGLEILEKRYAMGEINELYINDMQKKLVLLKLNRTLVENSVAIDENTFNELQEEISKIQERLDLDDDTKKVIDEIKDVVDKLKKSKEKQP